MKNSLITFLLTLGIAAWLLAAVQAFASSPPSPSPSFGCDPVPSPTRPLLKDDPDKWT